jgi:DegV family protein with EDD domain
MKKQTGILIDSASTYDAHYLQTHNIEVIPLTFSDPQNRVYDDDNQTISQEELLRRLDKKEIFKTSATPIGKLIKKVEQMLENYEKVIFIPIAIGLSSQYAQSLIVQQDFPETFFPIRSTNAALANEFVLMNVVELIEQRIQINDILAKVDEMYKHIVTYFSCEDLSGMLMGGRVTKAIVKVINFLKLKPIIKLDNKNHYAGVGKNYKTVTKKIINAICDDFSNNITTEQIKRIGIYYSGYDDQKKEDILNMVTTAFNFPKDKILIR